MRKLLLTLLVPFITVSMLQAALTHSGSTDSCELWMLANITYSVCIDTGQAAEVTVELDTGMR